VAAGYALSFDARSVEAEVNLGTDGEAMKGETMTPKSLFRNILHITPLNPKIWIVLACKPMIPQDRGEGGYPILTG